MGPVQVIGCSRWMSWYHIHRMSTVSHILIREVVLIVDYRMNKSFQEVAVNHFLNVIMSVLVDVEQIAIVGVGSVVVVVVLKDVVSMICIAHVKVYWITVALMSFGSNVMVQEMTPSVADHYLVRFHFII